MDQLQDERKMMKCVALTSLIVLISYFIDSTAANDYTFFPNLPVGEYQLSFKGITQCALPSKNLIQLNYYLNRSSATKTEIKGNVTIMNGIKIDDSLDIEFKLYVKDSIGGWKDNAFVYKSPKACSKLKFILGNAWTPFMTGLGVKDVCPIVAGTYIATGVDTALVMKTNFPKKFFYGTYKFHVIFSKNGENYGCFVLILDLKRPWEKE